MGLRFAWAWNDTDDTQYTTDLNLWTPTQVTTNLQTDAATVFIGPLGFTNYASFAKALRFITNNQQIKLTIPGATISQGSWLTRFYYVGPWTQGGGITTSWLELLDGGAAVVAVRPSPSGSTTPVLDLLVNGVSVATTGALQPSTEYNLGLAWDGTSATATLYLDGVSVATGSNGAAFSVDEIRVNARGNGGAGLCWFDSWTVWDSAGDDATRTAIYVFPSQPNADVTTTNWTSTGGDFFSQLADGSAATYGESTTTPATGNLQIGFESRTQIDPGFTGGTILGVGVMSTTQGDGALTTTTVGLDSGGSTATTAWTATPNVGWSYHLSLTDPNGGGAWTGTAFDAVTTLFEGS